MSKEPELKARDKVILRMTRDGAVEKNLTVGTEQRVSGRLEDAELVKPVETAVPSEAPSAEEQKKVQMRRQQRQFQAEHTEDNDTKPPSETSVTEEKRAENPPQNVTEPLPSETPFKPPALEQHSVSSHTGTVIAETVVTHKLRKTSAVEAVDADAILTQAAETASAKPASDDAVPPTKRMQKLERKSEKAHERLDAAREKLPTHKVLKKERVFDEETGKGKTRLHFEDELKKPKSKGKLQFEADKTVRKVGDTLASGIHGKIHEVEQENTAVEAAHKTEIVAETAARHFSHHREKSVNKPYEKVSKLEHKADTADAKLQYERNQQEHPEMKKQNMNKHYQKQSIKKEYAAARNAGSQTAGTATKSTGKKLGEKASNKIKEFFEKNKKVFIWIGVGIALLVLLGAGISSCSMLTSTGSSVIASSYLSEDDAMLGAEAQYCRMEQELQSYLDNYESNHDYDEYHFDLDDIEHDPYVLISILSALHEGEFTLDEVQGTLQMLFEKQYILTEEVIVETRYRTETDTWTDADGNTHTETYRVPYDYYICNVKLENFNLSHVPVHIMSQEQLSMYATYMAVLGNREDLFGDSPYVDKYITNPPADYDVNPEYLNDEKFATLITEAEKYLGYPYVWGGSNPDTSFDCSGFVSYVLTNSGLVNTGRLGAQGLYNVCTPVSKANAQPGDLIFFVGTYDTPGVSHVGIYVGDGVMIHCGDPIQYTSINSSYWQQHFYAFGRPAY